MSKLLSPMKIGRNKFKNRVVMAPMCMFHSKTIDGVLTKEHFDHYVARALGGVSGIIIEATMVNPTGGIRKVDLGLYNEIQMKAFKELVDRVHNYDCKIGIQLSHAGRKADASYNDIVAPSSIPFADEKAPRELTKEEILKFKSAMLVIFGEMDWEKGWTQQFHYGAIRNNNTKMFKLLGPDTGFDSIGEFTTAKAMSKFLDRLNVNGKLTKTILYNLNPCANEVIATMLGNFQDGSIAGKIQFGSGWWFLDQKDGMEKQMNALSVLGLLSRFVGMLTDSRSFLSYPRHEYFRRTLCNLVGRDVENGEIPVSEMDRVNQMIEDISYNNAKNFFKF